MNNDEESIVNRLAKIGYSANQSKEMYSKYFQWNKLPSLLDFLREKENLKSINRTLLQPEDYLE